MARDRESVDGKRAEGVDTDAPTVGSATESMDHTERDLPDDPVLLDEEPTRELIQRRILGSGDVIARFLFEARITARFRRSPRQLTL